MSDNEVLEKRMNKIINWFKDPFNLTLFGIILFALGIRLYFMFLTKNQAVWWDEGEYMLRVKHLVLGTPQSGFFEGRELFTPYFWAAIYYFFRNELGIRFIQVIISTLTVLVTYFLGKEVYDKKTGLLAALFMSSFWLHLFFTCRLLTYLYAPLFYTLALALFWKGYCTENKHKDRYLYLSFITLVMGLGIYSSITFAAFPILIYLFITKRFSFLKDKRLWKYGLLSLPFLLFSFIPSYLVQGSIMPRLRQMADIESTQTGAGVNGLFTYVNMMPRLLLTIYLFIIIIGLILFLSKLFISFDLVFKKERSLSLDKDLFIFIAGFFIFAFYTYVAMTVGGPAGASYDAWILPLFPLLFILSSSYIARAIDYLNNKTKIQKNIKLVIISAIVIILLFGFYSHIKFADTSIKNKIPSYYNLIPAGEWLKQNSLPGDLIVSGAIAELTYYSEREVVPFANWIEYNTSEQFVEFAKKNKPKYLVWTIWEDRPSWTRSFITSGEMNLTLANVYFLDKEQKQPDVVIFKPEYSSL